MTQPTNDGTLPPPDPNNPADPVVPPVQRHDGLAIVFPLRLEEAELLALPLGEPPIDMHVTAAFYGDAADVPETVRAAMHLLLASAATTIQPFEVEVAGLGRFEKVRDGSQDCVVALVGSPALDAARAAIVRVLSTIIELPKDAHGFIPHIAVAYGPTGFDPGPGDGKVAKTLTFDRVSLWTAGVRVDYSLGKTKDGDSAMQPIQPPRDDSQYNRAAGQIPPDPSAAAIAVLAPVSPARMSAAGDPSAAPAAVPPASPPASVAVPMRVVPFEAGVDPIDNADWNRSHAVGRLRGWASEDGSGDYEKLDYPRFATAFAWVDPAAMNRGSVTGFRLPHHDVIGGVMRLSKQGLLAAARALMGGEHGIPNEDLPGVQHHLEQHFVELNLDPPWRARKVDATEMRPGGDVVVMEAPEAGSDGVVSRSWIQVARIGQFRGHPAGPFQFTPAVFDTIIRNFTRTTNRAVPVDYEHATEATEGGVYQKGAPAIGWIVKLDNRGQEGLWGYVEWINAQAVEYVRNGQYRFFSPAVSFNAINAMTGEPQGPTLVSGGLTNRPFLDGMTPITARSPEVTAASARLATCALLGARLSEAEADVYRLAAAAHLSESALTLRMAEIASRVVSAPEPVTLDATVAADVLAKARAETPILAVDAPEVMARVEGAEPSPAAVPVEPEAPVAMSAGDTGEADLRRTSAQSVTDVQPSGTPTVVDSAQPITAAPAAGSEQTPTPAPVSAVTTLKTAVEAAYAKPKTACFRDVYFYGDTLPAQEDILSTLACVFGMTRLATNDEIMQELAKLARFVSGDMGERDGVPVAEIVGCLRRCFGLPTLSTAEEIITAVLLALTGSTTLPMSVGPSDVHIPSVATPMSAPAVETPAAPSTPVTETTSMSDPSAPTIPPALLTALGLPTDVSVETAIGAATTLRASQERGAAEVKALSDKLAKHDLESAERRVDALIGLGRVDKEGRAPAVAMCMRDPDQFALMFPARQSQVPAAPHAENAGSTQMRALGTPVSTMGAAPAQSGSNVGRKHSDVVYERACTKMKADSSLSLKTAMTVAEEELAIEAQRR